MSKIGLIAEGGGMKCAYGAGVIDGLLQDHIKFPYCIGVSAGSANLASYMAGQYKRNLPFYDTYVKDPVYFGAKSFFKTGNLFNLHYIYATLSNEGGLSELHFDKILKNPAEYEIVATNALTGEPVYFNKHQMIKNNYCHIMASSAIPAVCKPIFIDGTPYYDGGISEAIPVKRAFEMGCDKVVCILSKSRHFVKQPEKNKFLYSMACRKYPNTVKALNERHLMYKRCQDTMFEAEKEGKAFIFSLETDLAVSTYKMDPKVNRQLYDLGYTEYVARKEALLEFMSD